MSQQLTIYDAISDSKDASLMKSISEQKHAAIQRFLDTGEKQPIACVNSYSPGGRKSKYYRLSYFQNKKTKHLHIPGGNINSELATYRARKLQELILRGAELPEILALVADFRGKKPTENE